MAGFTETLAYVQEWADRTDQILLDQLARKDIGITDELRTSVRSKVHQLAGEQIRFDLSFLSYGRYRDMGAGRPAEKIESRGATAARLHAASLKGRKPAKWYSRPFYGRLHALSGVVSTSVVEQAIAAVRLVQESPE